MEQTNLANFEVCEEEEDTRQLDLFSLIDYPEEKINNGKRVLQAYSNSVGTIDLIPRFKRGVDAIQPINSKNLKGKSLVVTNHYTAGRNNLICEIKPAIIQRKSKGEVTEFYAWPSDRENMIESVLFMLASNQGLEKIVLPSGSVRFGIYFTLYQIRQELKKINKTKSYDTILEALIVIRDSSTIIMQQKNDKKASINYNVFAETLLEVQGSGRGRNPCCIIFSDYIVEQIKSLNFRQYPFTRNQSLDNGLARWVHHYLTDSWTNAMENVPQKLSLNAVFNGYGKHHLTDAVKRRDLRAALEMLVRENWFKSVPKSKKELNNGIADYSYSLVPTEIFVLEVIKANAKKKGLKMISERIITDENFEPPKR
jgi:hypothetical protein